MLNDNKNTYLAKWLTNDLSKEDLEDLKKLPEYEDYEQIIEGMHYFKAPKFDSKTSLNTTLDKLEKSKKGNVIRLKPWLISISAAASILLIIGLFFNKVTYNANPGEQLAITLPDGSNVQLNAGSTISHNRFFWSNNRVVDLKGEAFFKVTKGETFKVQTSLGAIEVLGTQFNVKGRTNIFAVDCYEGKVRVSAQSQQEILTKGDAVILKNTELTPFKINTSQPLWITGESLFNSVALQEVLDEIERQFDVSITRDGIDQNRLFTGGFIHSDLTIALEAVLTPMSIRYQINNKTITLSPR